MEIAELMLGIYLAKVLRTPDGMLMEYREVIRLAERAFGVKISNHRELKRDIFKRTNELVIFLKRLIFLIEQERDTRQSKFEGDVKAYEKEAWQRTQLLPQLEDTCMSVQFGHIMSGGYSAGYYSYKWAEVLDADAFSVFKETGIFNQDTARSFRENILSKGGTEHPMTLYKRFRGQEPTIEALLKRNGIK